MKQQQGGDAPVWRWRDEFQQGLNLHSAIRSKVGRNEIPTDEELSSYSGFQQQVYLLAHDLPAGPNPLLDFYQDLQADMQRTTGETAGLIPPVHGLTRDFGGDEAGWGGGSGSSRSAWPITEFTDNESEGERKYFMPKEVLDRPFEITDGLIQKFNMANAGELVTEIGPNGKPRYVVSDGVETWDMTEQMGLWNRPGIREKVLMSFKGEPPIFGGSVMAHAPSALTAAELISKLPGIPDLPRRYVHTAIPGLVLPWEVPLGDGAILRGDEDAILRDPLYARALSETKRQMQERGELESSGWDSFKAGMIGLADLTAFWALTTTGTGAALGALGKAATAARAGVGAARAGQGLGAMGKMSVQAYADASGYTASRMFAFPFNTHFAKTAAMLSAHGAFSNITNPDTRISDDILHGVGLAAELAVVGSVAKIARSVVMGAAARIPWVNAGMKKVAPRLWYGTDPSGLMSFSKDSVDRTLAGLRGLPSRDKSFTGALYDMALGGVERESILRSWDGYWVGAHLAARGAAEMYPGYEDLPLRTKVALYWRNLASAEAIGTGASFVVGGLAMAIPKQREAIHKFFDSEQGKKLTSAYVRQLGSVENMADARVNFELFEKWRAEEPELFENVVTMNPEAKERFYQDESKLVRIRDTMGWNDVHETPTATTSIVEPSTTGGDALQKFGALVTRARGVLAGMEPSIQRPVYYVGELTKEFLNDIGFKDWAHAQNALYEYMRVVDGNTTTKFEKLKDVPTALFERALEWRDRQKTLPLERGGEEKPSMLDQLRAQVTPPAERLPRQQEIGSKIGEPLRERGAFDVDLAQSVAELEGMRVAFQHLFSRGRQRNFKPAERDAIDLVSVLRLLDGVVRRLPKQAFLEGGGEDLLERLDDLMGRDLTKMGPTETAALWLEGRDLLNHVVGRQQRVTRQGGMTLEQAAANIERVEGNPVYAGKPPLQIAKEVQEKKIKGRIAAGSAAYHFKKGTEGWDQARLEAEFPEVKLSGDSTKPEWIKTWLRRVQAVWTAHGDAPGQLRHKALIDEVRREGTMHGNPVGLQAFVRALGGINPDTAGKRSGEMQAIVDLSKGKGRAGKAAFLGPLVTKPGSGKGGGLGSVMNLAIEAGYFPGRKASEDPTSAEDIGELIDVREFADALAADVRRMEYRGMADLETDYRAGRERMHGEQLAAYREDIENGSVELPVEAEARRGMLFDAFAGDARFAGMTPERVEQEVMNLRGEAAMGAPAPADAAPAPTAASHFQRAAAHTRRLVETLQTAGILPPDVGPQDSVVSKALVDTSMDRPELRTEGVAKFGDAGWARVVEAARLVRQMHRDAILAGMEQGGSKPENVRGMQDAWAAIDAHLAGEEMPADVRSRLQAAGRLDADGFIHSRWEMLITEMAAKSAFEADREAREKGGSPDGFGSFIAPVAFFGTNWTHVEETTLGKALTAQSWMDRPGVQQFLSNHPFARALTNRVAGGFGPFSGPIETAEREMMKGFLTKVGVRNYAAGLWQFREQFALARLWTAWQGSRPPTEHMEFATRIVNDGTFKAMRGPEDLERIQRGTGYLWTTLVEMRDLFDEIGRDKVQLGLMTQAKLDALGGGAYIQHRYVRDRMEQEAAQLGRGEVPLNWVGSLLPRQGQPSGAFLEIKDYPTLARLAVREQSTLLKSVHILRDLMEDPLAWKTDGEMAQMNAYQRSRYQPAAVRMTADEAARVKYKPGYSDKAVRFGVVLGNLEKLMAKKGEEPGQHQIPYDSRVDEIIKHYLGEAGRGRMWLSVPAAKALDLALQDLYVQQADRSKPGVFGWGLKHWLDQSGSWRKRSVTVGRNSYFVRNFFSNAAANHATHRNSLQDLTAGIAGGPSFTRTSMDRFAPFMRWLGVGAPKVKPRGWSARDWRAAQAFKTFDSLQSGSNFAMIGLSPDMADNLGLALDNHNVVRDMLTKQAHAKKTAEGWTENELESIVRSVAELTHRLQGGLEPIDEAIGKMIGSPDPVAHARAFGGLTAVNYYADVVMAKYPAYLKAQHEYPNATPAQLVAYASAAAGDMRNASLSMKPFLSMRSPGNSELWMKTTPHAGMKVALSMLFRNRFWMWRNATIPLYLQTVYRHPISSVGVGAVLGLGVQALFHHITQQDPEEAERFEEEMRHARNGAFYNYAVPRAEREALERVLGNAPTPGILPRTSMSEEALSSARAFATTLWQKVWHGFAAEGGKRQGEARIVDLRDMTGPIGELAKKAQQVGALYDLATGGVSKRKLAEVMDFGERTLGMEGQLFVNLLLGGPDEMVDAMGGKTSWGEAVVKSLQAFGRQMPEFYPVIGMLSPSGQHIGENVWTGGMPFNDYAAGIERAYRGETSAGLLAEAAGTVLWPSRAIRQQPALRSPTEWLSTTASAVLGETVDATTERGRESLKAATFVPRELSQVFGDLYQQHRVELGKPETTQIELDDRMAGALTEMWEHTVETMPGRFEIEPGYQPKGAILKAISNGSEKERDARIRYLRRYVSQESFQEAGMNALLEVGRRAGMGVGFFREAMRRTMIDPSSTNLLGWWWDQIKGGNRDALEQLAPLINDTPMPAPGSEAYSYWLDIRVKYDQNGLELPLGISDEQRAIIEKRSKASLMLQGGKAFTEGLQHRSLFEAIQK